MVGHHTTTSRRSMEGYSFMTSSFVNYIPVFVLIVTVIWIVIKFDVDGYVPGVLPLHKIEGQVMTQLV